MKVRHHHILALFLGVSISFTGTTTSFAQESLPEDNGIYDYHRGPDWRESESHPLRVAAYILHPVGWLAREVIFRPLSYFASSTPTRRSVMGYRDPYDYKQPSCFNTGGDVPDCRTIAPFNYAERERAVSEGALNAQDDTKVAIVFPHVNFDFDKSSLNASGKAKAKEVAAMLREEGYNQGEFRIVIEGHTDEIGSTSYNEKLGLRRAESVMKALAQEGIESSRMSTVSFGEAQPLSHEKTEAGRAMNRRVEVRVK